MQTADKRARQHAGHRSHSLMLNAAGLVLAGAFMAASAADPIVTAQSDTAYSRDMTRLQSRFDAENPSGVRAIILDQDYLQMAMILNGRTPADEEFIGNLLHDYLQEKTGKNIRHVDRSLMGRLQARFLSYAEGNIADVAKTKNKEIDVASDTPNYACVVMGQSPDEDSEEMVKNYLGLYPETYGAFAQTDILGVPDYRVLKLQRDYHEFAHCLHGFPWGDANINLDDDQEVVYAKLAARQKYEIFADVLSILMLVRDGYPDISQEIADLRLSRIAVRGPFDVMIHSPMTPDYHQSYTHSLVAYGLRQAHSKISGIGAENFRGLDMSALMKIAFEVTEDSAVIPDHAIPALAHLLSNNFELDDLADDAQNNAFLVPRYNFARAVKANVEEALRCVIGMEEFDDSRFIVDQIKDKARGTGRVSSILQTLPLQSPIINGTLSKLLVAAQGEGGMTEEHILKIWMARKDHLRGILDESPDQTLRRDAARELKLMPTILRRALIVIGNMTEPTAPAP